MKFELEEISSTEKKINVEIPYEEVERILDKKYKRLRKKVKIKGFRPGKAPRFMLERFYGNQVLQETIQELVESNIPKILDETKIKPLTELEYDFEEIDVKSQKPLKFSAIAEVKPDIEIDSYKGLQLKKEIVEVTDEEVQERLQELRERNAFLSSVEEPTPVKDGDFVVIDFDTIIDEKVDENLSARDFTLELGKAQIHKDFDSQLQGMKVGEGKTITIVYSPETPNPSLAGKEVQFRVTLKEVKERILPELDDEFAKDLGPFSTIDEIKDKIKEELLKAKESQSENRLREQLFEQLLEKTSFDLPKRLVDRETQAMVEEFKKQLEARGLTLEDIHSSEEALREEYSGQAERQTRLSLILDRIAQLEEISNGSKGGKSVAEQVVEKLIEWAEIEEVPEGALDKDKKKDEEGAVEESTDEGAPGDEEQGTLTGEQAQENEE